MKNDSRSLCIAEVEVSKVKFSKAQELGIDFSNQIDAWSRMEFKFRHQIHHLRRHGTFQESKPKWLDLRSYVYAVREEMD